MSKKWKGRKGIPKHYFDEVRPDEINQVAKDMFGGKYYCIGDKVERGSQPTETPRQEDGVL